MKLHRCFVKTEFCVWKSDYHVYLSFAQNTFNSPFLLGLIILALYYTAKKYAINLSAP